MTAVETSPNLNDVHLKLEDGPDHFAITPLKIALLSYRSHPFVGGQGIYVKYLSRALADLGHKVDVISGPPYPEIDDDIKLIKVPSLDLYARDNHVTALRPRHFKSFTDLYEWWTMLSGGFAEPYTFGRRVKKLLNNRQYDIIHDNQSLARGILQLQDAGVNVVSTIHHPVHHDRDIALKAAETWGDRLLIKRWYSFLRMQEKVVRELKHVVTVSHASQKDISKYFGRPRAKIDVIPNGIATDIFKPLPHVKRMPLRVMTTASSDQPLKGLKYLITAVAGLRRRYPNIHLRILGRLKEEGETQRHLESLGMQRYVSFVADLSTQQLVEEYAQASAVVCPSLYEGFGLPAAEAMACGCPVIATNGGALPEVLGDAGIVVPTADSDAIASALMTLFENTNFATHLGQRARRHIQRKFSWSEVATQLSHYYTDILRT